MTEKDIFEIFYSRQENTPPTNVWEVVCNLVTLKNVVCSKSCVSATDAYMIRGPFAGSVCIN